MRSSPIACAVALCLLAAGRAEAGDALTFERLGQKVKELDQDAMAKIAPRETVTTDDPYYGKVKRFTALPLAPILVAVFGESVAELRKRELILSAKDGYRVPISGERLLEDGAYLAIADLDRPRGTWEPIGPRKVDAGPYYLVWKGKHQRTLEVYPRPWQLVNIAIVSFETIYAHTVPPADDAAAVRGGALFRQRCLRCHAINREGGRIGPDLNVPKSITEYRPVEQIRAYIKDPLAFRYGMMPANPDFDEHALDDLVAYLRAMAKQKHDPERRSAP